MMRDVWLFNGLVFLLLGLMSSLIAAQSSSSISRPGSSISSPSQSSTVVKIQNTNTPTSTSTPPPTSTPLTATPSSSSSSSSSPLPLCTCQAILSAQSSCRPSAVLANLQTNNTQYQQCFCHSQNYLFLANSSSNICATDCPSQNDRNNLRNYYVDYCDNSTASTATTTTAITTTASVTGVATNTATPARPVLSKKSTIGIAIGASLGLILLCAMAYYPVFVAARRTLRSSTPSLAGSRHRRGSSSSKLGVASTSEVVEEGEESEGGAPVAEIQRSPVGRSRRSSMGDVERGPGSPKRKVPKSPELVHVLSVAAFKES